MLIHLTPTFFLPAYPGIQVDLVDIDIPELNMKLNQGIDLMLKTPHPNKSHLIACRKKGKKAINGIFIQSKNKLENFTVTTRWEVSITKLSKTIVSHTIHFSIIDSDFDAVSSDLMLWDGFYNTPFETRSPEQRKIWIPAYAQPRMYLFDADCSQENNRASQCHNTIVRGKLIIERVEYFTVPTIERERLFHPYFSRDRLPSEEDTFYQAN